VAQSDESSSYVHDKSGVDRTTPYEQARFVDRLMYPIPEAAARLGIGRTVLYQKIAAGQIGSVLVGRRRLIPDSALRAFVANLEKESQPTGREVGR
jgi:excisionase family DNA binding protein